MSRLSVDETLWKLATVNLNIRRGEVKLEHDNVHCENPISDYRSHLKKCGVGESVLDVGCGTQYLRTQLPEGVKYIGIDAFPIFGTNSIEVAIEDDEALSLSADTVCAFAILDNCRDFKKAIANMKQIAKKNIIILTGIGIDPDKFHTIRLEMSDFDEAFKDWSQTHKELISTKVYLLSYAKP
jgi:SAM-dependent methyltransferase